MLEIHIVYDEEDAQNLKAFVDAGDACRYATYCDKKLRNAGVEDYERHFVDVIKLHGVGEPVE